MDDCLLKSEEIDDNLNLAEDFVAIIIESSPIVEKQIIKF